MPKWRGHHFFIIYVPLKLSDSDDSQASQPASQPGFGGSLEAMLAAKMGVRDPPGVRLGCGE